MRRQSTNRRMSMRKHFLLVLLGFVVACATATRHLPPPPVTEAKPVTETLHGVAITDPYRWLEDQQSPETRAWIDRQNLYTDSLLGQLPQKQKFAQRVQQLLNTDQIGTPVVKGGRYFFSRR